MSSRPGRAPGLFRSGTKRLSGCAKEPAAGNRVDVGHELDMAVATAALRAFGTANLPCVGQLHPRDHFLTRTADAAFDCTRGALADFARFVIGIAGGHNQDERVSLNVRQAGNRRLKHSEVDLFIKVAGCNEHALGNVRVKSRRSPCTARVLVVFVAKDAEQPWTQRRARLECPNRLPGLEAGFLYQIVSELDFPCQAARKRPHLRKQARKFVSERPGLGDTHGVTYFRFCLSCSCLRISSMSFWRRGGGGSSTTSWKAALRASATGFSASQEARGEAPDVRFGTAVFFDAGCANDVSPEITPLPANPAPAANHGCNQSICYASG